MKFNKQLLIKILPFVFIAYFADKIGEAYRISSGANIGEKLMNTLNSINTAFQNPLPSFYPQDLLVGVAGALIIKAIVYFKGKNAKKYRKGIEYGSARWGTAEDWKPYKNDKFAENVILTESEHLTMDSRPKNPKHARNKNILVIGGSGSGKTRFFVKPNLLQMHSSYVVTDPKGKIVLL